MSVARDSSWECAPGSDDRLHRSIARRHLTAAIAAVGQPCAGCAGDAARPGVVHSAPARGRLRAGARRARASRHGSGNGVRRGADHLDTIAARRERPAPARRARRRHGRLGARPDHRGAHADVGRSDRARAGDGLALSSLTGVLGEGTGVDHLLRRGNVQFSRSSALTRPNSEVLLVTSVSPQARACAAMKRSLAPIMAPRLLRSARISA